MGRPRPANVALGILFVALGLAELGSTGADTWLGWAMIAAGVANISVYAAWRLFWPHRRH